MSNSVRAEGMPLAKCGGKTRESKPTLKACLPVYLPEAWQAGVELSIKKLCNAEQ